MSENLPLVLITGASGFLGSHIAQKALDAGYPIRLVSRPAKLEQIRSFYRGNSNVDVMQVDDVATGDFTAALQGVVAIMHVASPVPINKTPKDMMNGAIGGTMNIAQQAAAAGVKRFIFTSSSTTCTSWHSPFYYTDRVVTDNDWNDITREQILDGSHDDDPYWVYAAVKTIAEKDLWKFAEEHPEMDVTTINPPMVYGPLVKGLRLTRNELEVYSSPSRFYYHVFPPGTLSRNGEPKPKLEQFSIPLTVDVRDVAKAHVLALTAPSSAEAARRKRILLAGPTFLYKDAVEYLSDTRPALRERLADPTGAENRSVCVMDVTNAREILGMTEFVDWRTTVDSSVDSILEVEAGYGL